MDTHGSFFKCQVTAPVFCQCDPAAFDLTVAGFMAQLGNQFKDLAKAGRSYRMSPGLKPAGCIKQASGEPIAAESTGSGILKL